MASMNNMNNHIYDTIFNMMANERNLLSVALTSKDMYNRVKSYLRRTGRQTALLRLELAYKLKKNRQKGKNWSKRPRNNNNNGGAPLAPRQLAF